jgi:hypothetical protein
MPRDRYLRVILTIIAIELLWLGLKDVAPSVAAQAPAGPTPVVITGVRLENQPRDSMPTRVVGTVSVAVTPQTVVRIQADRPLKVEADTPLPVQQVDYTPRVRPGE